MDRKSKILITIFFTIMFVSAAVTYYRYMILKDYEVVNTILTEEDITNE